jgi:hypothetical protein
VKYIRRRAQALHVERRYGRPLRINRKLLVKATVQPYRARDFQTSMQGIVVLLPAGVICRQNYKARCES